MSGPPDNAKRRDDDLKELVREMFEARRDLYRATQTIKEAERVLALALPNLDRDSEAAQAVTQLIEKISTEHRNNATSGDTPVPDAPMTAEQAAAVAGLTAEHIAVVDESIVAFAGTTRHWRKVARVVADVMSGPLDRPGVPDVFYSSRVRALVAAGQLES